MFGGVTKIVASFETTKPIIQLRNLLENEIWPKMELHINNTIQNHFKSGVKISTKLKDYSV